MRVTDLLIVGDLRACSRAQFSTWQGPKFPAPSLSVCPAPAPGLSLISPDAVFPRWYHGHMSGGQAETLLQAKGEPWTFLVRESLSQPGDFVLSVLSDQPKAGPGSPLRVTHIKVMCEVRPLGTREAPRWGFPLCPQPYPWGGAAWALVQGSGSRQGDRWPDLEPLRADATQWGVLRPSTASLTWWSISRGRGSRRPPALSSTYGR